MNRRAFFSTLLAPYVARFRPPAPAARLGQFQNFFTTAMLPRLNNIVFSKTYSPMRYGLGIRIPKSALDNSAVHQAIHRAALRSL